jgi:hypothetical protein
VDAFLSEVFSLFEVQGIGPDNKEITDIFLIQKGRFFSIPNRMQYLWFTDVSEAHHFEVLHLAYLYKDLLISLNRCLLEQSLKDTAASQCESTEG